MRDTKPIALLLTGTITTLALAPSVAASIVHQPSVANCDTRLEVDFGPPEGCDTGSTPPKAATQIQLSSGSTAASLDITMISGRSYLRGGRSDRGRRNYRRRLLRSARRPEDHQADTAIYGLSVSRYKGRSSAKIVERDFPHIVEMVVRPGGFGRQIDRMYDWHRELGVEDRRGSGRRQDNRDFVHWCFADQKMAADFAAAFGGSVVTSRT